MLLAVYAVSSYPRLCGLIADVFSPRSLEQNLGLITANVLASAVSLTNWVSADGQTEGRSPDAQPTEMRWPGSGSTRTSIVSISDIKGLKPPTRLSGGFWPLRRAAPAPAPSSDETALGHRNDEETGRVESVDGFELVRDKGGVKVVKTLSIDVSSHQPRGAAPPMPPPRIRDGGEPPILQEGAFI
jgi:hypothetical protein